MREDMISPNLAVGTPRKSAAATLNLMARKRNRTPSDSRNGLPRIDSGVFELSDELVVPKGAAVSNQVGSCGGHLVIPSPPQPVGVLGVDSNKRINLWNEAADRVTGALSYKIGEDYTHEQYESDDESMEDPEKTRKAFGMSFEDLFPPEMFEISSGTPQETPITMLDVVEKVLATGEPSMAVPVISRAGRKRGRYDMTNNFSVDFLPQFKSCPMFVSSTNVSGVILVCKAETMTMIRYRDDNGCNNLIDMAHTLPMDKPRSLSAGSSGTCPTENETETETVTETTDILDKEIETEIENEIDEIGNSFHTCMIDSSFRTNFVDNSFRTCQIDVSGNTVKKSNRRLEALEAFGADDDSSDGEGDDDRFFNLPSPPLLTPTQRIGNRNCVDDNGYKTHFEELRALIDTANAPIFGIDADG